MLSSDCRKCQRKVTAWSKGMNCERCDDWYRVGCVVVKEVVKHKHMKVLRVKNIWFMCDVCQAKMR